MPDSKTKSQRSRRETLTDSPQSKLPEIDKGEHLITWLFEFGPVANGFSGAVPVAFSEILAWATLTRTSMDAEEALLLKQLSTDYCNQHMKSTSASCPPPYSDQGVDKKHLGKSILSAFKSRS